MRLVLALALLSSGCVTGPGEQPLPGGETFAEYVATVDPILGDRCGNPSCHGTQDRPLALFAVHQHRLDPANVYRDLPLTQEELWSNLQHARAFLQEHEPPETSLLVQKPLAESEGGARHEGGTQWADHFEHECQVLLRWIAAAQDAGAYQATNGDEP